MVIGVNEAAMSLLLLLGAVLLGASLAAFLVIRQLEGGADDVR